MGIKKNIIKKNCYKDSVFLMQIAADLEQMDNINNASLMMGTPANKDVLRESGLLTEEGDQLPVSGGSSCSEPESTLST